MNLRSTLIRADSPEDVTAAIIELDAASVIADVEPLACMWGSDDRALLDGTATVLHALERAPSLVEVVFVTNSRRVPSVRCTEHAPLSDGYCSHARKPWIDLAQFRALQRPLVVVGDQLLTDGLLRGGSMRRSSGSSYRQAPRSASGFSRRWDRSSAGRSSDVPRPAELKSLDLSLKRAFA